MLKLYVNAMSAPANRVVYTANALELEYEMTSMDLANNQQKTPEFLAINPIGKVPAMDDNGFMLAESHAIMKYMARKAGKLYPQDIKKQAEADMMMDFIAMHLNVNMSKLLFSRLVAPMRGMEPDERAMAEGEKFLKMQLPVIEDRLSKNPYLMGAEMSLPDLSLISVLDPMDAVGFSLKEYPNICAYREKMMKKEFYTQYHPYYGSEFLPQKKAA